MKYQELLAVAKFLYGLLDDIDTVGDMVKADDVAYRKAVEEIQKKKSNVVGYNDGFRIEFKAYDQEDKQMDNNTNEDSKIKYIVKQNSDLYEAYYKAGFTGNDAIKLIAAHGLKLGEGK